MYGTKNPIPKGVCPIKPTPPCAIGTCTKPREGGAPICYQHQIETNYDRFGNRHKLNAGRPAQ